MKRMIAILMFALCCGMAASASAQEFLFEDDFSDNRNQWPEEKNEKTSLTIRDGKYILLNKEQKTKAIGLGGMALGFDTWRDFQIETSIKIVSGFDSDKNLVGISWGAFNEGHIFYISRNSGKWAYLKGEKEIAYIKGGTDNTIRRTLNMTNVLLVKKQGTQIQFFVNGKIVGKTKFDGKNDGIFITFIVAGKGTLEVDSFKMRYFYRKSVLKDEVLKPTGRPLDALARAELEKYVQAAATATPKPAAIAEAPTPTPFPTQRPVIVAIEPTPPPLATVTPVPAQAPTAAPTPAEKKLALLIGNGAYPDAPLQNPANDARAVAAALKRLGFDVIVQENAGQKEMKQAIDKFGQTLKDYDVGVFFYSGHGVQVNGQNYLIPVDANPESINDVEYDCVNAGRVLGKMEDAGNKTNIIILDACRNNPFERSWTRSAKGSGLAFMNAPSGSLIAYATSPGNVAFDVIEGDNSPYTAALLQHLETPNISILEMFQRVRGVVMKETDEEQIPWESTSLTGNFYFNPK